MVVAAFQSKPPGYKETAILAPSQLRYFAFNYKQAGNPHCHPRSPFTNTPYHFTSFKPLSLHGDFTQSEKGTYFADAPNLNHASDDRTSYKVVLASSYDVSGGGGGGGGGAASSGDSSNSKEGCWGGSNLGGLQREMK